MHAIQCHGRCSFCYKARGLNFSPSPYHKLEDTDLSYSNCTLPLKQDITFFQQDQSMYGIICQNLLLKCGHLILLESFGAALFQSDLYMHMILTIRNI